MGSALAAPAPYGCIGCKVPQPDYPPALITFMFCAMVITIVVDLIGNSMVILAVTKNKKLRNSGKPPFLLPIQRSATCHPQSVNLGAQNREPIDSALTLHVPSKYPANPGGAVLLGPH